MPAAHGFTCGNLHLTLQHRLLIVVDALLHRHEAVGQVAELHAVAVDDLPCQLLVARVGPASLDVVDSLLTKLSQLRKVCLH